MRTLGTLRGIAILTVVISHAAAFGMIALAWWGDRFGKFGPPPDLSWVGTPTYYTLIGVTQLTQISVPVFLFAAGFYVAYVTRGNPKNLSWSVIRGQVQGLILPFVVWMVISVVLYLVPTVVNPTSGPAALAGLVGLVQARWADYYFVPALGIMLLLSPVLARAAFRYPGRLLALSAILGAMIWGRDDLRYLGVTSPVLSGLLNFLPWSFPWRWIFFFALGLVLARYQEPLRPRLARWKWPLAVGALGLGLLSIVEADLLNRLNHGYANFTPSFPSFLYVAVATLALASWEWRLGRFGHLLDRLGIQSYGIYLVQALVIGYAAGIVYHLAPSVLQRQVLLQPLLLVAGLGGPMLVMWATARSPLRRYQRLLFGSSSSPRKRTSSPVAWPGRTSPTPSLKGKA